MPKTRPMAERRELWRADIAAYPRYWDSAYSWLRTELADLERGRKSSIVLRLRTWSAVRQVRREATCILLRCAAEIDATLPAGSDEVVRRLSRRHEMDGARTADERMWRARGWVMSSEGLLGKDDGDLRDRLHAQVTAALASLAESIAAIRRAG